MVTPAIRRLCHPRLQMSRQAVAVPPPLPVARTGLLGTHGAPLPRRRERSKVPYIVRQCVEEIERRGMEEVGIYRVSGVATDIQALKAAFDVSEWWPRAAGGGEGGGVSGLLPRGALTAYVPKSEKKTLLGGGSAHPSSQPRGPSLPLAEGGRPFLLGLSLLFAGAVRGAEVPTEPQD